MQAETKEGREARRNTNQIHHPYALISFQGPVKSQKRGVIYGSLPCTEKENSRFAYSSECHARTRKTWVV